MTAEPGGERRDIRAMRRAREQSRASALGNTLSNSSTDESARSPSRGQRSRNENHPGLTPLIYSGDQSTSRRREDTINSRSRSSPPGAPTEQRNSLVITFRASSDRGNCRNISTALLLNRIMGRFDADGSNLNRRVRPSSNIRTSRRSRGSSTNGRGMRDPPNLPMTQGTGSNPHAPSRISTTRRSGSVDSSMVGRGRTRILPPLDTSRLVERLATLSEAELSSWFTRVDNLYLQVDDQAAPAESRAEVIDRWRRIELLMDQLPAWVRGVLRVA